MKELPQMIAKMTITGRLRQLPFILNF